MLPADQRGGCEEDRSWGMAACTISEWHPQLFLPSRNHVQGQRVTLGQGFPRPLGWHGMCPKCCTFSELLRLGGELSSADPFLPLRARAGQHPSLCISEDGCNGPFKTREERGHPPGGKGWWVLHLDTRGQAAASVGSRNSESGEGRRAADLRRFGSCTDSHVHRWTWNGVRL